MHSELYSIIGWLFSVYKLRTDSFYFYFTKPNAREVLLLQKKNLRGDQGRPVFQFRGRSDV